MQIFHKLNDAGNEAEKKYAEQFKQYKISTIELPNKDINETFQLQEPEIFTELKLSAASITKAKGCLV